MRIGINGSGGSLADLDGIIGDARSAHDDGFDTFWLAQIFNTDALTALAVAGREVPGIGLGTAVVPTWPRHPQALASQALTVQAATGGRLRLGIGLSHQIVVESMWGFDWKLAVRHMAEYLDALLPLLAGESVDVHGTTLTAVGNVSVTGATPPSVLVAALGTKMLQLTGGHGLGTITWCTGLRALADHVVPKLHAAAAQAGHPAPPVVASLPVGVTDDPDGVRGVIAEVMAMYGMLPSYRSMLDIDGAAGPADVAIVGSEAEVEAALGQLAEAGVTEFAAVEVGRSPEERSRTREVLRRLASDAR